MCELVRGGPCAIRHIGPDAPTPNSALLSRALNKVNDFNACTIPQFSALNSALNSVHRIRTKHCTALSVSFCIFGTNFLVCPVRPSNPWDRSENPKKWPSDPIAPAPGPGPLLDLDRGSLDRSGSWRSWRRSSWTAPAPGVAPGLLDLDHPGTWTIPGPSLGHRAGYLSAPWITLPAPIVLDRAPGGPGGPGGPGAPGSRLPAPGRLIVRQF